MRITKKDNEQTAMMILRGPRDPETESLSAEVRTILGLDPAETEFNVVYGAIPRNKQELAILTRSFFEIIIDLSANIEVPEAHVAEKRVSPTFVEKTTNGEKIAAVDQDSEFRGKTRRPLYFGSLSQCLFLDRRPGLDVQGYLFLFDVHFHPDRDRRQRDRSHCDDSHRVGKLPEGHGSGPSAMRIHFGNILAF